MLASEHAQVDDLRVIGLLAVALALSTLVGFEREFRAKNAGMRTHTLVGLGACAFMLVSKYGFGDLLGVQSVALDPSRVAAQIVSGIGFIGGGLIFVRRDAVRGLTTAATVWVTAAIGMACGGGLLWLALAITGTHFLVVLGYPWLLRGAMRTRHQLHEVRLTYLDGHGVLRRALATCTHSGWVVVDLEVEREQREIPAVEERVAAVSLRLRGRQSITQLVERLRGLDGVLHASTGIAEDAIF
ncbi:membrane protein [Longimycelium tulufanense]|uniref:Membrane protein n=1 Tax=Longimycelium tulufanense TaxID=907463 RepID=A0A8J3CF91_9PSEU|nr:MgtC/SapB family protein [Longimycelium tulufanense]GGM59831.1 membrane protein [Longimycelium tulufanense]